MIKLIIGVTIGIIACILYANILKRKRCNNILNGREELTDENIYEKYYSASNLSREHVYELWHEIASVMGVLPGKIRPTDRIGKDIGRDVWLTTEKVDVLSSIALDRLKKYDHEVDISEIYTVDDYIIKLPSLSTKVTK